MSKKIGTFLMVMLVLCAVLILMAAATKASAPVDETTPATTAPADTKAPEPSAGQTQPSPPEAALPAAPTEQNADASARVARILEGKSLGGTAVTRRKTDSGLNKADGVTGTGAQSMTYALAELAQDRKMNPIAAFWLLVDDGAYADKPLDGPLGVSSFQTAGQPQTKYAYTNEGSRQLLSDLLVLAAGMEDGLGLEQAILGENLSVESDQIFYSEADGCRYAYFSASSERSTHILCFYLRGDGKGEWITDVEFQLLSMRHAAGDAGALTQIDHNCDRQAAVLMAAAELVLTGSTTAAAGQIPDQYAVGTRSAAVERFAFTAEGEQGTLTNYRLR